MALITLPPARSKLKSCRSGDLGSLHRLSSSRFLPSVMSHQYPAPDPSAAGMDIPQSTYAPIYSMPPQNLSQEAPGAFNDQSGISRVLKRSSSTPSVGGALPSSSSEQPSLAAPAGEKKRNKLGYHRTSLACNHCRRRKIRCIASPDDQNRCINCIRLKKECSFYPVDQQPPPDPKLSSQPSGGTGIPTAASSPAVPGSSPVELASHQRPYSPMPVAPVPGMVTPAIQPPVNEYFPPETKVPSSGLPNGMPYGLGDQPIASWITTDATGNPIAKTGDQSMAWRPYPAGASISGQFPPYSHASAAPTTWESSHPESGDGMGWSNLTPNARSISVGAELLGSQVAQQAPQFYPMAQNRSYERLPGNYADMYTPSMGVSMGGMDTSTGQAIDPTGPIVGPVLPSSTPVAPVPWEHQLMSQQQQHQQQQQQHQQQQQQQMQYPRRGEDYGGWGYRDDDGTHQM